MRFGIDLLLDCHFAYYTARAPYQIKVIRAIQKCFYTKSSRILRYWPNEKFHEMLLHFSRIVLMTLLPSISCWFNFECATAVLRSNFLNGSVASLSF